jgi:hypothetical protein
VRVASGLPCLDRSVLRQVRRCGRQHPSGA